MDLATWIASGSRSTLLLMSQYMVEFDLPPVMDEGFANRIPAQRLKVEELMEKGFLLSYSLSVDRQKLWCIFKADSELEVMESISEFPLIKYMTPMITELMFHNMVAARIPLFSLNWYKYSPPLARAFLCVFIVFLR